MSTDYVLFIHGMNTRQCTYANDLIKLINQIIPIEARIVFWGDLADKKEGELLYEYRTSGVWNQLWFRNLREQLLLRSVGDIALYLSREVSAKIADLVAQQITSLKNCTHQDRLHLATHSLGTVILFDLLFSTRWDDERTIGHDSVMAIREAIYGIAPHPERGIRLGSITTMGSPIGIFGLVDVDQSPKDIQSDMCKTASIHDIHTGMAKLLHTLHQELRGGKLAWCNFIHPGDPFASPLAGVLPQMLAENMAYIDFQDILISANLVEILKEPIQHAILDLLIEPIRQSVLAILDAANAHESYWQSTCVAERLTQLIQQAHGSL